LAFGAAPTHGRMTSTANVRTLAAAVAGLLLLTGAAARPVSYPERLGRAVDTCVQQTGQRTTQAAFVDCVDDLAAPNPSAPREADIWPIFLDCVAEWYRALDESTPPDWDVNDCLEDHGVDVGP
jgi:hypothetical protein